jgi:hypothetical protein
MFARRVVATLLAAGLLLGGCQKEEPAPPAPPTTRGPALSEAEREALVGLLEQAPADAVVVGAVRSPRAMVDGLNGFAGPEFATLTSIGLAQFPAGAVDMEKPIAVAVSLAGGETPHLVFLAYVRDAERLAGLTVEEGIKRIPPGKGSRPQWFAMPMEDRVALALAPEALAALKAAEARFDATDAVLERIGPNLAWLHVEAEPLATLVRPQIQQARKQAEAQAAQQGQDAEASKEVAFFAWLEDLLGQVEHVELAMAAAEEGARVQAAMRFREDASALAVAQSLKPIESYETGLPQTDRFFTAGWVRMDHAEAGKRMREFLGPPVEMLLAKLDEVIAAAARQREMQPPGQAAEPGPAKGLSELGKAVKDLWALVDEQGDALGEHAASLVEIPEPGEGLYATTAIYEVKDSAAFDTMVEKGVSAARDLVGFVLGQAAQSPTGPNMELALEYEEDAETIEGVAIDVITFDLDIQPPPGAPAEMQGFFKDFMEQFYGPDGLKARVGVVEGHAVVTLGPKEVMSRALVNLKDGGGDLADQPAVRRALARAPEGSRYVELVSLPGYAYMLSHVYGTMFTRMSEEMGGVSFEHVPLPEAPRPEIGEPMLVALRVEDRTVLLDADVPASELSNAIRPFRHAMAQGILFGFTTAMSSAVGGALQEANHAAFTNNMKQVGMMAHQWASSHRQQLPPADAWMEKFRAMAPNLDQLVAHPASPGERAIAMNKALGGGSRTSSDVPSLTVLFFECRPGAPLAGGRELLPDPPRHPSGYLICFLDGHVETVPPERIGGLIWDLKEQ